MSRRKLGDRAAGRFGYTSLRLHTRGAAAWAVISVATGAIATDPQDRLLMSLTKDEANRIAETMTGPTGKADLKT